MKEEQQKLQDLKVEKKPSTKHIKLARRPPMHYDNKKFITIEEIKEKSMLSDSQSLTNKKEVKNTKMC